MSIVKECGDIWSRLFDHQHFTQPEIHSFAKEFEEKRSDREVEHLLNVLHVACELSNQCDKVSRDDSTLNSLNDKVKHCLQQTDNILNTEKAAAKKNQLLVKREERQKAWEQFRKAMEPKYLEVDAQFMREEEEIKKFYKAREKNL